MILSLLLGCLLIAMLWKVGRTAIGSPHLRRMALRNLVLHKSTTLFTVLGAMIGTALITAALLFQHSLVQSGEQLLEEQFGRIGYDLPAGGAGYGNAQLDDQSVERLQRLIAQGAVAEVDALLPTVSLTSTLIKRNDQGGPLSIQPNVYLQGFDRMRAQSFDRRAMQDIPELGEQEILLSSLVANRLEVAIGDQVSVVEDSLRVVGVVPEQGLLGYRGIEHASASALVAEGTARRLADVPDGQYTNILLRQKGYLFGTGNVGTRSSVLFGLGYRDVAVRGMAEDDLEHARRIFPIFSIASWSTIAIGLMMILNIFRMIAEERRQELGVLRAIGMTQADLTKLLRLEGAFYALLSSAVGLFAGIGLAKLLLASIGDYFSLGVLQMGGLSIQYQLFISFEPLITGFATGAILIYCCSWQVSTQAATVPIVEALYDEEERRGRNGGREWLSIQRIAVRLLGTVLTVGLLLLSLTDSFRDGLHDHFSNLFPLLLIALGFFWTLMTSLIVSRSFGKLALGLQWVFRPFGRLVAILRMALRNLEVHNKRTALLVLMFALVFFLTSLSGVFRESFIGHFTQQEPRVLAGGYDLYATAGGKRLTSEEASRMVAGSDQVNAGIVEQVVSVWQVPLYREQAHHPNALEFGSINGIDRAYVALSTLKLIDRDPAYRSDLEAWLAVVNDPGVMIVSERHANEAKIGEPYQISLMGGMIQKRIIGIAAYDEGSNDLPATSGVFLKQSELPNYTNDPKTITSQLLFRLTQEETSAADVEGIEKALSLHNIYPLYHPDADRKAGVDHMAKFFDTFASYSLLSALIGIGGLGVIMFRMVHARRQQIGMLRAVGVSAAVIYWSLLIEGSLIGMLGIALGSLIGSYVGTIMVELFGRGGDFPVLFPYGKMILYMVGTQLLTLLLMMLPARLAFRLSPAEATKYVR